MDYAVDVLVPVHSASRPIVRLVESVLNENQLATRVIFVAHNLPASEISLALGHWSLDPRVLVIPFADGVASPAGPLRFGLEQVEAPFFCKIDSDDYLASGALDSWFAVSDATGADIVLPSMRLEGQLRNYPTPPRRPWRNESLDPLKDRLVYRTSTMGLVRSTYLRHAAPIAELATGEDILPSIHLWFSGAKISAAPAKHCYVVSDRAADRVTAVTRPISEELAFVPFVTSSAELSTLDAPTRSSIVTKLLRVQVFGAIGRRSADEWSEADLRALSSLTRMLLQFAPEAVRVLSRRDRGLLDVVLEGKWGVRATKTLSGLGSRKAKYTRVGDFVPREFSKIFSRDAPLRFLVASLFAQRRVR